MSNALRLLGWLAILALPVTARAQGRVLEIHGTVAADEKAADKIGYDAISIGFAGAPPASLRWIGVVTALAGDVDAFRGKEMLDAVDGYTPNLLADGTPDLLTKLREVPAGSRVVVHGLFTVESRVYFLDSVKTVPAGSPR